ncbi:MAG: hypothetical protein K5662_08815 [Lachnospiraceae bacterium]|nr:hypothetical protein [Lachnospiraceae bacterium]
MKLRDRIEDKFSNYAISNITLYLIICYALGYIIQLVNYDYTSYLTLEPSMILKGQIWRLVTWLIIPPSDTSILFIVVSLFFYYSIGRTLEKIWGTYRLNEYLISGFIYTIIGSFVLYIVLLLMGTGEIANSVGDHISTYYVNMSLFLAFAATMPEVKVYLYFILPVKVKYLGIIYALILLYEVIVTPIEAAVIYGAWGGAVVFLIRFIVIGCSMLNFVLFFNRIRRKVKLHPNQMKTRVKFRKEANKVKYDQAAKNMVGKHKCAVCGRTDLTDPELEFRFCSRCNGNYEYCNDHIFTHTHVE